MSLPKLPTISSHVQQSLVTYDSDVPSLTSNPLFQRGRSYVIGDSKVPHQLPAPSKLRPYIDRKAGQMDTWPAHSAALSPVSVNEKKASKPKFLEKLEGYLVKELRALGCSDDTRPSEKRLQAFREVFEYLIDDFRTYKPLLSAIKHEYEAMLTWQKEAIHDLEPLKAMLVNINDQCEQKVLNLKQLEKQDLINLRNENGELQDVIASLKDEIACLQQQVKKCQNEVAQEYQKYRDESDARKLLIQDINDLKYQQDEAKRALMGGSEDENGKKEDAVMLRIALRKARDGLNFKTQKLSEVLADYGDVVPRRDFEKLEARFKEMESGYDLMKKDYEGLMKEHSTLIDVHKKVMEQRDNFALDSERMRRCATPRPDWDKCASYIEGGIERWNELSTNKSTNEKVDVLLAEITGQDVSVIRSGRGGMVEFFEGKGEGEDIPRYLRSVERIRNRRVNKRDLLLMIKDIWQEKIKEEGGAPFNKRSNMAAFLYKYLKQRFSVDTMVIEWGYNIHDALMRYNFDSNVALFSGVLNGELDEDNYHSQLSQLEGLYIALAKSDTEDTGTLNKADLHRCLTSYFTNFNTEDITSILASAEEELGGFTDDIVPYRDLFTEDDEGKSGPFIMRIQELSKQDKDKLLKEIKSTFENRSEITPDELRESLQAVDPKLTQTMCEQFLTLGFRVEMETLQSTEKLDKEIVLKNLRSSCIRRT